MNEAWSSLARRGKAWQSLALQGKADMTRHPTTPPVIRAIPPQAVKFERHQCLRGCALAAGEFVVFGGFVILLLALVGMGPW